MCKRMDRPLSFSKIDRLRWLFQCVGDEVCADEVLNYTSIANRRALRNMLAYINYGVFKDRESVHLIIRKGHVKRIK